MKNEVSTIVPTAETVADIVAEMREEANGLGHLNCFYIGCFLNRIEAAYERDKNSIIASMMLKDKECGELHEMLKPILECDVSYFDKIHWRNAFYAVMDVQREAKRKNND